MGNIILQAKGLTKSFGQLIANNAIDMDIEAGKIHAIAGENGAGKSTLMKMLYGIYPIDSGTLIVDGEEAKNWNSAAAREKGVSMVFQDFRLIPVFTVLENVYLSMMKSGRLFKKKKLRQEILRIAKEYNLHVDPDQEVWKMDLGQRQHIEIIKVLINPETRVMIFDEPTSVLAPHEIESFLDMLAHFRDNGYAILLITHKINEIVAVADEITVLRHGEKICHLRKENGFDRNSIISAMLGEDVAKLQSPPARMAVEHAKDKNAICLHGLSVKDDHNRCILKDISFDLQPGTIVGIAGISGNGQRELAEAVFGIRKIEGGKLLYGERDITNTSIKERIDVGFRMVTEDPMHDNVVPGFTVLQNMALVGLDVLMKKGDIDWDAMRKQLDGHTEIADLHVPAANRIAGTLSGGNMQRMSFARAIISRPNLLLASYPSRGLDVATVAAVHKTLFRLRSEGVAILLISEDLPELFELSDSLMVLSSHTAFGPFVPQECDMNEIGKIMLKGDSYEKSPQTA